MYCFLFHPFLQTKWKAGFHRSRSGKPAGWWDGSRGGLVMCSKSSTPAVVSYGFLGSEGEESDCCISLLLHHKSLIGMTLHFLKWYSTSGSCLQAWECRGRQWSKWASSLVDHKRRGDTKALRFLAVKDRIDPNHNSECHLFVFKRPQFWLI